VPNSSWLLRPVAGRGLGLRLLCFPYAGGGGSLYVPWARELTSVAEVCAVQPPGREGRFREQPYDDLTQLMDAAYEALAPYLDVPFALFGHSMGALLAFEFARRIRRAGGPQPLRLLASGHRAPQLPSPHPPIAHLPDAEFITEVRQRYGGVPDEVLAHAELMALLLPCLRADMALIEGHRHTDEAPLDCPVSVYGGLDDAEATETELAAWRTQTSGAFRMERFPGTHFYVRNRRTELLLAIRRDLADVVEPVVSTIRPR
jgi:medium-chain acyl-[acyl-carrier-protein] hydrolase